MCTYYKIRKYSQLEYRKVMAVILDDIRPNFPIVRCRDSVDHFIFCTTWYKIVKLKASLYIWDMNQARGQDGWILAKCFFACL